MLKFQPQIMINWLQVCQQRDMLRMIDTPREILCYPKRVGWEPPDDHWNGIASCN